MPQQKPTYREVPTRLLELNPHVPLVDTETADLQLLASIEEFGILHPLAVHQLDSKRFQVIDGRRRLRCARLLRRKTVPCTVYPKLSPGDYAYMRFVLNDVKPLTQQEKKKALRLLKESNPAAYEKRQREGRIP